MNQKIDRSNQSYLETVKKAEEKYGKILSQEKLDFKSQNSLTSRTYNFSDFKYYLELKDKKWSIVFQNTLILNSSLENKTKQNDKKIKVYRFRMYSTNPELDNWQIQECQDFQGNYSGRSVYQFWREYNSAHIEVLAN
jgi:hypothetical protein